jgi:UPF0755 protein
MLMRLPKPIIVALVILVTGLAGLLGLRHHAGSALMNDGAPVRVTLEPGTGLRSLARQMHARGFVAHPLVFIAEARLHGGAERLQAGVYEIRPGMSVNDLLAAMIRGDAVRDRIRFIEGWTFSQMRAAMDAHPGLRHDTAGWSVGTLLERVGAIEKHPEGLFFPDSYQFAAGSSDLVVWRKAYAHMRDVLERAWRERSSDVPVTTPYEALILASIVEKETGRPEDRPRIAAVFSNRLRIGMRLQSDPTVIYGLGPTFDGNLRRADLERDSPYNTYVRAGLPPTPIAAPGAEALRAATNPPASRALYFVAKGDGTSEFSENLDDHNRAVNRYQKR